MKALHVELLFNGRRFDLIALATRSSKDHNLPVLLLSAELECRTLTSDTHEGDELQNILQIGTFCSFSGQLCIVGAIN